MGELVDRAQVEVRELDELAHARLVEERVADDRALDAPEQRARGRRRRRRRAARAQPSRTGGTSSRAGRAAPDAEQRRGRRPRSRRGSRVASEIVPWNTNTAAHATKRPRTPRRAPARRRAGRAPARRGSRAAARPRSRTRAAGTRRSPEERRDVARGEEAHALAVARPSLAAEDQRAQPERPEQEPPRALGLARPAVLGEEAQDPAQVLGVQPPAVRGAAEMHDLGGRREPHLPAGRAGSGGASRSPR